MSKLRLYSEEVALYYFSNCCPSLFEAEENNAIGVVAVDEVGRGCLAGPVLAGASLWLRESWLKQKVPCSKHWVSQVADSKQLSPEKRLSCFKSLLKDFPELAWFDVDGEDSSPLKFEDLRDVFYPPLSLDRLGSSKEVRSHVIEKSRDKLVCVGVSVGAANVSEIDNHNVWGACQLAMGRAMSRLEPKLEQNGASPLNVGVIVDGKIKIKVPRSFAASKQMTAIGADERFVSAGVASIAAKVMRDSYMDAQAKIYPNYFFEKHKGYATAAHREAIAQHRPTPIHRKSFVEFGSL